MNVIAVVARNDLPVFLGLKINETTTAVMMIEDGRLVVQQDAPAAAACGALDGFRDGLYSCLTRRADALFELVDAVLCTPARVTDLAHLSLEPVFTRGHGALYDGLNAGRLDIERLSCVVAGLSVPRCPGPDGRARIVLAVDVSNWLRPDAATSPGRSFCHVHARTPGAAQIVPGWKYSWVVALEPGASSWTMPLDVRRLSPEVLEVDATAAQLRQVIDRLIAAGHWRPGDPPILVVMDSGYDITRLTWLLADLPVTLIARVRSNRVFYAPAGKRRGPTKGRGPRHGHKLVCKDPATWPEPSVATTNTTERYGTAAAVAFTHHHPKVECRTGTAWEGHEGEPPIIAGTLIQLTVEHLPGSKDPDPVWLWTSAPEATCDQVDHYWSMYLRRFDLEHTFRFLKQTLGWTRPMLRDPEAADRWTWLLLTAYTQLRLARAVAVDDRLPWQRRLAPTLLTPGRVRAGYRRVHATSTHPANAPKANRRPGPGRPPGRRNKQKAPIQPVGKTTKG